MTFTPMVNGLRTGTLVEITEGDRKGNLGQLCSYDRDTNKVTVVLLSGETPELEPSLLKEAQNLQKPGRGGDDTSFDILMGPATPPAVLAEELSDCIFEKGFCVLKVSTRQEDLEKTVEAVRTLGDEGRLGRLPQEVEEGYLGEGGQGKVVWLDPDQPTMVQDEVLNSSDENLSYLASLVQPYSMDCLGKSLEERTPALVSLSMTARDEEDYPHPMASDKTLGDYLGTWRRGLLRVVHFMGPAVPTLTLESRGGPEAAALPFQQETVTISAAPGTIVLFRTDCFQYKYSAEEEVLMMMASFLSESPQFTVTGYTGDTKLLTVEADGPAPPAGQTVNIMEANNRLAKGWDDPAMLNTGLQASTDSVEEIPITRFDVNAYFIANPEEVLMKFGTVQKHTSMIDGVELFDNKYFEIGSNEAADMSPLQRLILEVGGGLCYSQGLSKKTANRTSHHAGVSVGMDKDDWPSLQRGDGSSAGGNAQAIIANRFSFVFNLKGPNYVCDTACSASLTATHCAKLMLQDRTDPLDFFLAMGTHMCMSILPFVGTSRSQMVSPEGRCFTFNASANGYLRGEGTGGLYLKFGGPTDDRHAIIRASQLGQDGRSASLTAPNGPSQEEMIQRAINEARITPPESTVWECHGTGTSLGDPIEVGAVRKIQIKVPRTHPLLIGTMKSNIGHLEGGAAMAGLVKCTLQVMHAACYTSVHLRQLNAHLEHAAFDAFFESELSGFAHAQGHCQISSLGFGGSNGHVVMWGKKKSEETDVMTLIGRRIAKMGVPEVRVVGDDPNDWESDMPESGFRPGDKYTITIVSDEPRSVPLKWVKEETQEEDDDDSFFSITGNFNGWAEDRMAPGDVSGQHVVTATVPSTGFLEFRFIKNGEADKVIAPSAPSCMRKSTPIVGPEAGLTNSWIIEAEEGKDFQIELMKVKDQYSLVWFKAA